MKNQVFYRNVEVNGLTIFFREAGTADYWKSTMNM